MKRHNAPAEVFYKMGILILVNIKRALCSEQLGKTLLISR